MMPEARFVVAPRVFIVVLNWNRASDTIECVDSLQNLAYPDFEIVVVDNASTDGSVASLASKFPRLTMIQNSLNLGYAGGNNVGIQYALDRDADYVLLLNNDTVVDRDLLGGLVEAAEHAPRAGIVGPKIYHYAEPTKIWFAGARIDWTTGLSPHLGTGEYDAGQFDQVIDVDRVTGCAMMVRREVFQRVGLFDPAYFLYYEDVDFCVRATKAGYRVLCVQTAKMWHKESSATQAHRGSNLHAYYQTRNRLLFLHKHARISSEEHRTNRIFLTKYLSGVALRPWDRAYRGRYSTQFFALADFYLGRYGIRARYHRGSGGRADGSRGD